MILSKEIIDGFYISYSCHQVPTRNNKIRTQVYYNLFPPSYNNKSKQSAQKQLFMLYSF